MNLEEIQQLEEANGSSGDESGSSTLIFGGPKVGKTEEAGKLAEFYKLIWFDLENGSKTLRTRIPREFHKNIELIKLPDTKNNPVAINTLLKVFTGQRCVICARHGIIGCVGCTKENLPSTIVELNKLNKKEHLVVTDGLAQLTDSAYNLVSGGDPNYKLEWDDWLKENQLLAMILSQTQQARYNSLFITHEVEVEMEDGTKQLVPLAGTKPFSSRVAKFFDNVVYMRYKMKKFEKGASQDFAINVVAGNRSGLKLENGISLVDLIKNNGTVMSLEDYRKNQAVPVVGNPQVKNNSPAPTTVIPKSADAIKALLQKKIPIESVPEVAKPAQPEPVKPITTTAADKKPVQVIRSSAEILRERLLQKAAPVVATK